MRVFGYRNGDREKEDRMSEEQTTEREEQQGEEQQGEEPEERSEQTAAGADDEAAKAQQVEEEYEAAKEEVKELEENPPEKLEDWPEGKAKYETLGGPEGEHGYHEGPEAKLGPSGLRHREDGSVEVEGEEVDDPSEYKGEPIPGGPTDPDTPNLRMDKATPDDVSDVAREAQQGESEEGESEQGESEQGESEEGESEQGESGEEREESEQS
jgi:hypothetical protein